MHKTTTPKVLKTYGTCDVCNYPIQGNPFAITPDAPVSPGWHIECCTGCDQLHVVKNK